MQNKADMCNKIIHTTQVSTAN